MLEYLDAPRLVHDELRFFQILLPLFDSSRFDYDSWRHDLHFLEILQLLKTCISVRLQVFSQGYLRNCNALLKVSLTSSRLCKDLVKDSLIVRDSFRDFLRLFQCLLMLSNTWSRHVKMFMLKTVPDLPKTLKTVSEDWSRLNLEI